MHSQNLTELPREILSQRDFISFFFILNILCNKFIKKIIKKIMFLMVFSLFLDTVSILSVFYPQEGHIRGSPDPKFQL